MRRLLAIVLLIGATGACQPMPDAAVQSDTPTVPPTVEDTPTRQTDTPATTDALPENETTAETGAPDPDPETPPDAPAKSDTAELSEEERQAAIAAAPHIYMILQPERGRPTSIVFAMDQNRNKTPSDDPAIRLTPEDGQCNPQELRRFNFTGPAAASPVFGPEQVRKGLSARQLPDFLAVAVTDAMLKARLINTPEESRAQNVCTRKLWQQLIVAQSRG